MDQTNDDTKPIFTDATRNAEVNHQTLASLQYIYCSNSYATQQHVIIATRLQQDHLDQSAMIWFGADWPYMTSSL